MPDRKKKILFIIASYTYGGGAESLLTTIVNHLDRDKYDVSIIEYHHAGIKIEPVNDNIHVLPPIEAVDTGEKRSKTYQLYHMPDVLINTYIKKDYDLYVSFNYLVPTFLLPKDTKNIAWIHSDVYDLADEAVLREKTRQDAAFDKVKRIVAISDYTEQSIRELFPVHSHKLVKIYNGVDVDRVRSRASEEAGMTVQRPAIAFVGRLEDRKAPVRLVQVLKFIHERGIHAHLYYIGEGEEREAIGQRAVYEEVSEYIHLVGYQENPFPILRQCRVTCLLSKTEGFSMGLLESVALGIPFVATRVGGAKELSNGETCGRLVDTDEQAAEAVCRLLEAKEEEMERLCYLSIEKFELKNYIRQIETLFDEVIDGR